MEHEQADPNRTGLKRATRSTQRTVTGEMQSQSQRKILKAKRHRSANSSGLNSFTESSTIDSSLLLCKTQTPSPFSTRKSKKTGKEPKTLTPQVVDFSDDAFLQPQGEEPAASRSLNSKRKLRGSAKVDVAQDDDNLSTETSSADERRKKAAKKKRTTKKKTTKRTSKKSKTSTKGNDLAKISEESDTKTSSDGEEKLRRKRSAGKEKKNATVRESDKENIKETSSKAATGATAATPKKIETRRGTYEVEEPSILLLNSPLRTSILDCNISGVQDISTLNRSSKKSVAEADSTTILSNISGAKRSRKRPKSTESDNLPQNAQLPKEKSPLKGAEAKRGTYELKTGSQSQSPHLPRIRTPPSGSSTPNDRKKSRKPAATLLKATLTKNVSFGAAATQGNAPSTSGSQQRKKGGTPARTKMPNFALIHKQAADRMENIQDFKNRHLERARELLSGCKSGRKSHSADEAVDVHRGKSKKQLNYSGSACLVAAGSPPVQKESAAKKVQLKAAPPPLKPGYNRFGFKQLGAEARKELKTAVANKVIVPKSVTVSEKRELWKGVRSNRRFDLLMQMRQKQS